MINRKPYRDIPSVLLLVTTCICAANATWNFAYHGRATINRQNIEAMQEVIEAHAPTVKEFKERTKNRLTQQDFLKHLRADHGMSEAEVYDAAEHFEFYDGTLPTFRDIDRE